MKTQTRNFLSMLIVACIIIFLAGPALAEVVTFNFTGTVTFIVGDPPFRLSVSVGDLVTGSIAYDPSLPPDYDTGSIAGYMQPPPSGMSVVISGVTLQSQDVASLQVLNNFQGIDNINGAFAIAVDGASGSMFFNLTDYSQDALSNTALPCRLDIGRFGDASGDVYDLMNGGSLSFSIDTLEGGCEISCITDADCDDGVFCNGTETCSYGNCVAVSACPPYVDGCVIRGSICDEINDQCLDFADDSRCGIGQTCDVITGECLTPCRVAQKAAQEAVASGGPYKNNGQIMMTATNSIIGYLSDRVISRKCFNCILSQFARGIPIYEQQACK